MPEGWSCLYHRSLWISCALLLTQHFRGFLQGSVCLFSKYFSSWSKSSGPALTYILNQRFPDCVSSSPRNPLLTWNWPVNKTETANYPAYVCQSSHHFDKYVKINLKEEGFTLAHSVKGLVHHLLNMILWACGKIEHHGGNRRGYLAHAGHESETSKKITLCNVTPQWPVTCFLQSALPSVFYRSQ